MYKAQQLQQSVPPQFELNKNSQIIQEVYTTAHTASSNNSFTIEPIPETESQTNEYSYGNKLNSGTGMRVRTSTNDTETENNYKTSTETLTPEQNTNQQIQETAIEITQEVYSSFFIETTKNAI